MNEAELKRKLEELLSLPAETECVEFKAVGGANFHFAEIGKYFSALSNEANLKRQERGWLVFGVQDKPRKIIGTHYRSARTGLDSLKKEIADKTSNRITFIEIHELRLQEGRVILFEIPPAPAGMPVAWEGHYYGRDGESLVPLNPQEYDQIRQQGDSRDWSAEICAGASLDSLEPTAIQKARTEYKIKHSHLSSEVDQWNDNTFLNKAKVIVGGRITRTAILLLGKPESTSYLIPSVAQISWILKDEHNMEKDYEHFGPPFLINAEAAISKIRNLNYRYLPDNTLFPIELTQYDPWVIREALHNCIAHQDYGLQGRIIIVENPDTLLFVNSGSFIPQSIDAVIEQDAPQRFYRNKFLAEAMANLNMIDTVGSGIKKMFTVQRNRFFPLPDYDLSKPDTVKVRITGKVIDRNYTQLLINNLNLPLKTVILLDRVQKREKISGEEFKFLKQQGIAEGRYPNIFVSAKIAVATREKAKYIKNRAFDKLYYKKMVIDYIKKFGSATRKDINELLMDKLSDILNPDQKLKKISNLLYEMSKKDRAIRKTGSDKLPKYILF